MNLQEFVDKYKGKPVDFDGQYGAQCVDLVRRYIKEVWELPRQPEGVIGAEEFYFKHESRPIQRGLCRCTGYYAADCPPPAGSVVVFKAHPGNRYGHIAICLSADASGMDVFEQDGIANERALKEGRPQEGAKISRWSYNRLAGWLEKKN